MPEVPSSPTSDVEAEAIRLLWLKNNPDAQADDPVPAEQASLLLHEVRQRKELIERRALDMLQRATRNPPTRGGNYSRHMQWFVLKVLLPLMILGLLVAGVLSVIKWLGR
ncbi:MAG: hypothetical protein H0W86_08780 [Armatimonadetes bacterium]|nr:hypothetical protein [Armatimonadota bacterium]